MRAWGLSEINFGECESTIMGKIEIQLVIAGSFYKKYLE